MGDNGSPSLNTMITLGVILYGAHLIIGMGKWWRNVTGLIPNPHWNMDAVERVQALTGHSGSDYGEDYILSGGHEQGLPEAGGIGGLGAQGILDQQMGLSGIPDLRDYSDEKKKKTKYRNIAMTGRFEDEDPSLGPMGDHPVIGDQGAGSVTGYEEDSHGFGGYDIKTDKVQTEPEQIANTDIWGPVIRTWGLGMFEEDQFNW